MGELNRIDWAEVGALIIAWMQPEGYWVSSVSTVTLVPLFCNVVNNHLLEIVNRARAFLVALLVANYKHLGIFANTLEISINF